MNRGINKRIQKVLLIFVACAVSAAALLMIRPPCLINKAFGFYCPACGTQRLLLAALHGDIAAAFRYNPFMFCVLPVVGVYFLCEAFFYIKEKPMLYKSRGFLVASIFIAAAAVIFSVLRNLSAFAFLAP